MPTEKDISEMKLEWNWFKIFQGKVSMKLVQSNRKQETLPVASGSPGVRTRMCPPGFYAYLFLAVRASESLGSPNMCSVEICTSGA